MMMVVGRLRHTDDGWIGGMRQQVDEDEEELNQMLDTKEREL